MTRRNRHRTGNGGRDQDLTLALARLEAAFGPVEVLGVHPNPRPATRPRPPADPADPAADPAQEAAREAAQGVLGLDDKGEGGEAVA